MKHIYEVPIVYRGQCSFFVEADSAAEAEVIARGKFNNGDRPIDLGNEYEAIERVGEIVSLHTKTNNP